jgi:hypothetical protein
MANLGVNGPEDTRLNWDAIDWRAQEETARRLRQRIFKATRDGDLKKVRNLQKLMLRSRANTLVSVRQAAQRNAGRKTAGQGAAGDRAARVGQTLAGPPRQAGVYTEGQWKASRTWHSGDRGPRPARAGAQRAGTGVGSPVRATFVRVSAGAKLSGRSRPSSRRRAGKTPASCGPWTPT